MPFFTDRCSENSYYLSLGSNEYTLKRISGKTRKPGVHMTGRFTGSGIDMTVKQLGALKKEAGDGPESGGGDVMVTISKGGQRKEFKAFLTYGP